ncbi:glycoside hydrolase family 38 C-terminal domain-containing protein [Paracidobacterium acidisoli]|uniref:Alpha-mannosidase n=1 Tax=Paracidobacterium acidisoli TaxID=2303751 RepID=A0A372IQX6_9BACT|nr:glycoside hydrolase family 38 C-terminal domain-containing protein [Paracidobacterium acidisoli]MBT9331539.1 alpha-mannosidase [Paracidobacterium acidisoli]
MIVAFRAVRAVIRRSLRFVTTIAAMLALVTAVDGQTMATPDITKTPTLFVVPYAHLDTQWRWEFPQTINEFLLKTMRVNFEYMDKYPHYVFNWTGANRYRLMKEYFPADYARIKGYVARGQWFPAGSSVEEGDVNLPGAEGIFRQILYGNMYFRHEFGKASNEFMLPDSFGFPASLPTILAHAGLKGFSTQKLGGRWPAGPEAGGPGSPEQTPDGVPFNVGVWTGPDGESVIAALHPGAYGSSVYTDLSEAPGTSMEQTLLSSAQKPPLTPEQASALRGLVALDTDWVKRIDLDGKASGVFADYRYVGTGDTGGAARESTVKLLEAIVTKSDTILPSLPKLKGEPSFPAQSVTVRAGEGPVHVIESSADQMFNSITPEMAAHMPRYEGDLELTDHSAGSLTSQAYHKRWIIRDENLADAAEKASIAAQWLGARAYPQQRLNDAWMLALAGHFHDTGAGTSTPRAYQYAWNDDVIAANQFAAVLTNASAVIASGLDTRTHGVPVVVYNPLNIARQDMVEAAVVFPGGASRAVRVYGPDGQETPAQWEDGKVVFLARMPSVGYAVFDVRPAARPMANDMLQVSGRSLENQRYRVLLNGDGDVSSIYDKRLGRELLSAPLRLAISTDVPRNYPAWNMDFAQEQAAPRAFVSGPAKIRISENGPARVSLEVTRQTEGSRFVQTVSLAAGDAGNRVDLHYAIDWKTGGSNLKAAFSLSASNPKATYSWDIGTVERGNAQPRQYEVGSHRWIDLTDKSGSYGVTLLTDVKNGSDKRSDQMIRVTLLRSPGAKPTADGHPGSFSDQTTQDWGHHEIELGLAGHSGDWRQEQTVWQAYRVNDPLISFTTEKHTGRLGRSFSLVHVSNPAIRVLALKKAEESDEIILRMVELNGKSAQNTRVSFAAPITSAREVNAQEEPIGPAKMNHGDLIASFTQYQPRTFALRLAPQQALLARPHAQGVALHYDLAVASNDDTKTGGGGIDGKGNAIPAEMLPTQIHFGAIKFELATSKTDVPNAVTARGQTLALPAGRFNRIYLLAAASSAEDQKALFRVGDRATELNIQSWTGWIGQWDTRIWKNASDRDWAVSANHSVWPPLNTSNESGPAWRYPDDYVGLKPGYVKQAALGWYASHHHTAEGLNEPYQYSYLFVYSLDLPSGVCTLTLPNNDKIRILSASVVNDNPSLIPAAPLFDTLGRAEP